MTIRRQWSILIKRWKDENVMTDVWPWKMSWIQLRGTLFCLSGPMFRPHSFIIDNFKWTVLYFSACNILLNCAWPTFLHCNRKTCSVVTCKVKEYKHHKADVATQERNVRELESELENWHSQRGPRWGACHYDLDLWPFDPKIYRCLPFFILHLCMKYEICKSNTVRVIALQRSVDRRTDRQTDGWTDRQTDKVISIGLPHLRWRGPK